MGVVAVKSALLVEAWACRQLNMHVLAVVRFTLRRFSKG